MTDIANMRLPFGERPVKKALEEYNSSLVTQKGGWFGLTGIELEAHLVKFKQVLRPKSPFIVVEFNRTQFTRLCGQYMRLPRYLQHNVGIYHNDLFKQLRRIEDANPSPRVPLFSYGHLDFCRTAVPLMRDESLVEKLYWLAKWNNLKNTFFFDITFSTRMDLCKLYETLMDSLIPAIFYTCGWDVINPKGTDSFAHRYREYHGSTMVNAFYKVVRRKPLNEESDEY